MPNIMEGESAEPASMGAGTVSSCESLSDRMRVCPVQVLKPLTDGLKRAGRWLGRVFCCGRGSKDLEADSKREPLLHTA